MGVRQLGCMKGLAIASLNLNSSLPHIDEMKILVKEKSIHVLALNETKLDDKIAGDLLRIDGYTLYREDRARNGGGVAVNVSDSLKHSRRNDFPERALEMISIEVEPRGARPFVGLAWYRPPSEPIETFTKLEKNMDFFDGENKEILIVGDTNCDLLKVTSTEMDSNLVGNAMHRRNIYSLFGFKQVIKEPTRETLGSSSLIDHVATNLPANIVDSGVLEISLSDHYLVFCIRKFRGSLQGQPKLIRSRRMKNFDHVSFLFDLSQIDWDGVVRSCDNVHDAVQQWSTTLSLVIEMHANLQDMRVSNKYSPWLNSDFRKLSRERDRIKSASVKRMSALLMDAYRQLRN